MVAIPDPATFRVMPRPTTSRARRREDRPDDLRRRQARREPVRGRSALRAASGARADEVARLRHVQHRPRAEYFLFKDSSGTKTLDEGGYFAMTALDAATELRNKTINALEAVGIPIEYHHHEVAPSQHEIDMRYAPRSNGRQDADVPADREGDRRQARRLRDLHAEAAVRRERSGMHTHMWLFKEGRNQFFDPDEPYHLSPAASSSSPDC